MKTADLAKSVIGEYAAFYEKYPPPLNYGDVTKVALDLTQINTLIQVTGRLSEALLRDIDGQASVLWTAQRETQARETLQGKRWNNKFNYHLWDLGTLATHLAANSDSAAVRDTAQAVVAALQPGSVVIAEGHHGDWFDGIGGVSIYAVPPGAQRVSPYYDEVALAQATRWSEMLRAYHDLLT